MNTEIFYFSGTGNSLFIANELMRHFPDATLTPIVKALAERNFVTQARTVGFVFPVHALTIPIVVKRFVEQLRLESAQYIFALATRGGTAFYGFNKLERLLKRKKRTLDARFVINMVLNDARNSIFTLPDAAALESFQTEQAAEVARIAKQVLRHDTVKITASPVTIKSADSKLGTALVEGIVLFGMNLFEMSQGVDYFYHTDACIACGICEQVCLSGKITRPKGKPVWQKQVFCTMCYACLNYCPLQAIQIRDIHGMKSHTGVNGRYHHPLAKPFDIAAQKSGTEGN